MVNVLQAMILTSDEKMVLTPTYYAFEMYKPFMDATYLPLELPAPTYQLGEYKVPAVHASAARGKDGKVYVALANLDAKNAAKLDVKIAGGALQNVERADTHRAGDQLDQHVREAGHREAAALQRGATEGESADRGPAGEVGGRSRPSVAKRRCRRQNANSRHPRRCGSTRS